MSRLCTRASAVTTLFFFSLPDIWPRSATLPTRHQNRKRLHTSRLRSFFSFFFPTLFMWCIMQVSSPTFMGLNMNMTLDTLTPPLRVLPGHFFWLVFFFSFYFGFSFSFSRLEILVSRSSPGIRCKSLISCHRNRQRVREIESNCLTKSKPKKRKLPERPRTVIRMIISYSTIAPLMMMSPIVKACLCT